ncbi:hypothetical protein [Microcoleus sp. LEGE 07076]|nr:hypothetical protein [Microcoleus sp. LEGE 07076]
MRSLVKTETMRGWDFLLDMMLDPPEPSKGLIALIKKCRSSQE